MTVAIGFLSLPAELICHILFLLAPRDLCRCAMTCKTVRNAAQDSIHVQYKLELYAQGFTETRTLNSIGVDRRMSSLKKLVTLWRSVFHASTVFEHAVSPVSTYTAGIQYMKCGIWWMWDNGNLFIRDCNTNIKLSRSFPRYERLSQDRLPRSVRSVVFDPIQDLVVVVPLPAICIVTGAEQNRHIFSVEFRLASSLLPHPDSVDASLKCQHSFEESGHYRVTFTQEPVICGDRIVVLYCTSGILGSNEFIQVIDWRKGHAKSYPLREDVAGFHLVDEQKFVVIDTQGVITLYTLQEHGSPQRRVMYRLQESVRAPFYLFHATPFQGATACPDLEPGYVPSLESQIIVLETLTNACPVILVIDMVIFSGKVLHSETPVEVPWSEWGPQYTCCFRHHPSCQISVFGSKIACALPRYALLRPLPLSTPKGLCTDTCFYVHILDFNQRVIARAENIYDPNLPTRFICKPSDHSHGPIISYRPYISTICRTQFSPHCFARLFLEDDRLTLTWLRDDAVHIQVVSPVQMEVASNLVR
ncbi:hypothetical protein DFJ58DRAFT_747570 [Suillus subalutaceus]|uniref:uncharacterized protein n=1 Tax=Suillus subalutaceus TaxID=48586 RepID=UPI001B86B32A|nr:uncharacterized protein DFJ58DRAFT_747570 [Suillus subalutaceus]KAG1844826.1 hypothetical protein DFJ58DRAFT_747570 [Suillus subalutaceus]